MQEAMALFDSIINGQWFRKQPVILFLNKFDLFRDKIAASSISAHFPGINCSETDAFSAASRRYNENWAAQFKLKRSKAKVRPECRVWDNMLGSSMRLWLLSNLFSLLSILKVSRYVCVVEIPSLSLLAYADCQFTANPRSLLAYATGLEASKSGINDCL